MVIWALCDECMRRAGLMAQLGAVNPPIPPSAIQDDYGMKQQNSPVLCLAHIPS